MSSEIDKLAVILWAYHNDELYNEDVIGDENAYIDLMNARNVNCRHTRFRHSCSCCIADECYSQAKLIYKHIDKIK